ncbi:MAG: acetylornithine/N-succinyldiaminopimelate aminotransferase [Actinomycetota bacterium]|jgi:acetylornithine aminotransferase|nr:acetylornithine/N-succinyldiaminopimelate aminotransferase [Actinomycetota bacterium]
MSDAWTTRFGAAMMGSAPPPTAVLVRGEGCYVWDAEGNKYLDFLAGIAVNSLGHAHPVLVDAVSRQIATLAHISNYFASPSQIELAERLKRISGAGDRGRVYFGNSGAEAIEAAIKLARLNQGRTKILALTSAFHGRTMGSLSLTAKAAMRDPFQPLLPGVEHIDATLEALEASIDDSVAALFVEPIQGEAGVVELPPGFLERARELTTKHGVLLILDEIQTGAGRTGSWFYFQQKGIVPDAIAVAKGIAGGVPIGALVTFGEASDLFQRGQHGSTFGGNPLATTAANAVLGEIERAGLVDAAILKGSRIRMGIVGAGSPLVTETRGAGLLIGVGLTRPVAHEVVAAAFARGLIVNAASDTSIRIAPPLIVSDAEIDEFVEKFTQALEAVA